MDTEKEIKRKEIEILMNEASIFSHHVDERKIYNQIEKLAHFDGTEKIRPVTTFQGSVATFRKQSHQIFTELYTDEGIGPEHPIVIHFCYPDNWKAFGEMKFEKKEAMLQSFRLDRNKLNTASAKKENSILGKRALNASRLDSMPLVEGKEHKIAKKLREIT